MEKYIETAVISLLYMIFVAGTAVLYGNYIKSTAAKVCAEKRLKERKRQLKQPSALNRHLERISYTVLGIRGKYIKEAMLILSGTVSFVGIRNLGVCEGLFIGIAAGLMPYLLIRMKFESIRRRSSFEGEMVVGNFLNHYRICSFNVYEALERMLYESRNTKVSNPLILRMLLELRNTGNPQEIKKAAASYSDMVGTNWSRMFAYNIRLAAEKGINISLGIEDILIQLRDARTLFEERKRMNSEAVRIVVYMIPFLYLFTVAMSVKFIGITPMEYLKNQFFTKEGFLLFITEMMLFLLNLVFIEIVTKRRFDY